MTTPAQPSGWTWHCPHCEYTTPRTDGIFTAQEYRATHVGQHLNLTLDRSRP